MKLSIDRILRVTVVALPALVAALFLLLFSAAGWGQDQPPVQNAQNSEPVKQNAVPPRPGAINYVQGDVSLDGKPLTPSSVGSVVLEQGETVSTGMGRVEILLTPGVFLRLDDNSAMKLISPDLANTEFELDKGRAMVEANDVSKLNHIVADEGGAKILIQKKGLYDFDANNDDVRVFKGKVVVDANGQKLGLGENRELALNSSGKLKAKDFDKTQYADDFYRWSGLRSGYLAEADADQARLYVNGGGGWGGPGWYWDPWFDSYTFIPGSGIFYSPFGWGFYSPFETWGSPFFYGGYYGHYHNFGEVHAPYGHGFEPRGGFRGGIGGGVRGGGFRGGGFRGGGGIRGGGGHR